MNLSDQSVCSLTEKTSVTNQTSTELGGKPTEASKYTLAVGDVVEFEYKSSTCEGVVFKDVSMKIWSLFGRPCPTKPNSLTFVHVCSVNVGVIHKVGECGVSLSHSRYESENIAQAYFSKPTFTGTYEQRQKQWVEHYGIKVGSKVKVVRKFEECEDGWNSGSGWESQFECLIGKTLKVYAVERRDVVLETGTYGMGFDYFPYFVLEPVQ